MMTMQLVNERPRMCVSGSTSNTPSSRMWSTVDGSQNAERGIPYFCLCVAVADGDTVGDVFFGYVYDFGANEEWTATRGEGALLNGGAILDGPRDYIEFMSLEATQLALLLNGVPTPNNCSERSFSSRCTSAPQSRSPSACS